MAEIELETLPAVCDKLFIFRLCEINQRFNVIYVRGAVPGHGNTFVRVTDALRRPHVTPPPFPTYFPQLDGRGEEVEGEEREGEDFFSVHLPQSGSVEYPNRYAGR